jgi:hypothetical protein
VWSSVGGFRPDSGPTGIVIEQDDPMHRQRRQLFHAAADPAPGRQGALDRRPALGSVIDQRQCNFVTDVAVAP